MSDEKKQRKNFTLTPEAVRLLEQMDESAGIGQSAILELLIRREAKEQRIHFPCSEAPEPEATP